MRALLLVMLAPFVLAACDSGHTYAPVTDVSMIDAIPKTGVHKVTSGETLYQIAWRYGLDYRYVAERNHIKPPYAIYPGQVIYVSGRSIPFASQQTEKPDIVRQPIQESTQGPIDYSPNISSKGWVWPAKGKVIASFSDNNKGINIAGHRGEPIYAAQAGKVVYCGNGLRGYGNLIILKHNSLYLSAYAHNQAIFVKEGQTVSKGQKIAEMGSSGSNKVMLHFEIRRAGKPISPLSLY